MITIPRDLYSKAIAFYIKQLVSIENVTDFYSLDDSEQDHLVSLGITALNGDIDIVMSTDANHLLAKYLLSHDHDDEIELSHALKEAAHEKFAGWFDCLIKEQVKNNKLDQLFDAGKRPFVDKNTGETLWI